MILAMLAFALVADKPAKLFKVISVDGVGYKVTQKGEKITVIRRGAIFHGPTGETVKGARIAAEFATGCTLTDTVFIQTRFRGLADCTKTPEKPTGVEIRDITAET